MVKLSDYESVKKAKKIWVKPSFFFHTWLPTALSKDNIFYCEVPRMMHEVVISGDYDLASV